MKIKNSISRFSGYLFLLPYLSVFFVFLVIPIVYGLGLSFFKWELISINPPKFIGFSNYSEALHDAYFINAVKVTLLFVIMTVPAVVIASLLIAVGINSVVNKRQSFYRASFFLPTLISISVAGILWRWFYNSEFGLFNAYLANIGFKINWITDKHLAMPSVVLMTLWWTVGAPTVIFLAGLQHIPDHYHEAAAIDGAGSLQRFWHITLPLLKPIILLVVVLQIIGSFQVFGQTYMVTKGGPELATRVLVQYIYETAFMSYRMGYGSAMSWLLFIIIAVFSFLQFKLIKEK